MLVWLSRGRVREFNNWAPIFKVLHFHGDKEARQRMIDEQLVSDKFEVCITSYEMVIRAMADPREGWNNTDHYWSVAYWLHHGLLRYRRRVHDVEEADGHAPLSTGDHGRPTRRRG